MTSLIRLGLAALGLTAATLAAAADPVEIDLGGDPEAGQTKAVTCVACHGQDGNSPAAEWPKLAGQHERYLVRQLTLYKSNERVNAIMLGMAATLSEQDMKDVAAYYSSQTLEPGVADENLVELGERIYRAGNAPSGVPACMACHGPAGKGNPFSGYPKLAGQHAQYTATQLKAFRDGTVWGQGDNANAVMAGVAANLTDAEIEAVASYLQGLYD